MMEEILLFGGTFNPPHVGHIEIAKEVGRKLGVEEVVMLPLGSPPHKVQDEVVDAIHRVNMLKLAIKNEKNFKISLIEVNRKGYTYTIDTLWELHKKYGDTKKFYYLIGADILEELPKWKDFQEVFLMCEFVVVARYGHTKKMLEREVGMLALAYKFKATIVDVDCINISSTDVRNRIKSGYSLDGMMSEEVLQYIRDNNLYRK